MFAKAFWLYIQCHLNNKRREIFCFRHLLKFSYFNIKLGSTDIKLSYHFFYQISQYGHLKSKNLKRVWGTKLTTNLKILQIGETSCVEIYFISTILLVQIRVSYEEDDFDFYYAAWHQHYTRTQFSHLITIDVLIGFLVGITISSMIFFVSLIAIISEQEEL